MNLGGVIIVRVNNAFGTTAVAVSGGFLKVFERYPQKPWMVQPNKCLQVHHLKRIETQI